MTQLPQLPAPFPQPKDIPPSALGPGNCSPVVSQAITGSPPCCPLDPRVPPVVQSLKAIFYKIDFV